MLHPFNLGQSSLHLLGILTAKIAEKQCKPSFDTFYVLKLRSLEADQSVTDNDES